MPFLHSVVLKIFHRRHIYYIVHAIVHKSPTPRSFTLQKLISRYVTVCVLQQGRYSGQAYLKLNYVDPKNLDSAYWLSQHKREKHSVFLCKNTRFGKVQFVY